MRAAGPGRQAITDHLAGDEYDFTLLDVAEVDGPGETVVADVRDCEAVRPAFEGQDAVVHLVHQREGDGFGADCRDVGWSDDLRANLEGINTVSEAAIDADVESVVFASPNHAVGTVEVRNAPAVYRDEGVVAGHGEPHRPDSRYGLSKSYGEDFGRLAAEAHGVGSYALRIGSLRVPECDHPYGDAERAWRRAGGSAAATRTSNRSRA